MSYPWAKRLIRQKWGIKSLHLFIQCMWGAGRWVVGEAHAATLHMWRSEDNFQELVLSFNHMDLGNWTQGVRLGSKCLCSLAISLTPSIIISLLLSCFFQSGSLCVALVFLEIKASLELKDIHLCLPPKLGLKAYAITSWSFNILQWTVSVEFP